ncbi:MAG: alpha/beta fold hydrolase [Flavobacteriaceae bacterium]|nr:alpha/beta fold hydrolase [Flavobacteriaceae bacterium]
MTNLYSNILGEGDKHIIILHGFLGMGDNWKSQANIIASYGFKVHLLDQRNHGRSFWKQEFNYNVLVDDLLVYMNEQNIYRSILIGHSMGGKTAMVFSFKYPERLNKLIVIDISPKKHVSNHDKILNGLASFNFDLIKSRKEADIHLSRYVPEIKVRQFLLKNLFWISPGKLDLRLNISVLKNSEKEVGREITPMNIYKKPVLFLKGENSDYILNKDLILIDKYFPKSKVEIIKNAGHWLHSENQKDFINKVSTFIN